MMTHRDLIPGRPNLRSVFFALLILFLILPTLQAQEKGESKRRFVMVCSTTQVADLARQVCGDRWDVQCVLGPAEDPHKYEVGPNDSVAISRADLCAENGWNLEGGDWMKTLAKNAGKPLVTCVQGVSPLNIDEDGKTIRDPHAWFHPKNAVIYLNNIRDAVSKVDPANKDEYAARADLYTQQLRTLTGWAKRKLSSIPANRRVLVTHHDAFGYFCEAFDFQAVSPLGWTTGEFSELSVTKRQKVVGKIRELGVKSVFVESSVNQQLLLDIAKDAGVEIGGKLYSDAMGAEGTAGETYIGMMRENVLTILRGLN